ncbi:RHS repeat-associated core domain-containing protein, partial [Shewanella sp. SACH]|uniref:RHS repeat-associated core domain-containing protein n=1 Tax=Shewanella sp. SACH TaxID=1873135 RepID=UPI002016874C
IQNKNTLLSQLQDLAVTNKNRRGFTDHEHLNEQQLIHMNGRIYDYNLGRFMSVDPFIQSPTSTQSVNPYSYIMNNPLAGTDPTGYKAEPELEKVEYTKKTEKVAVTGSRIKREVTTSVSGTATYSNGATQSFSASYSNGKLSSASVGGMSSVGSLQQTAAKSGDSGTNQNGVSQQAVCHMGCHGADYSEHRQGTDAELLPLTLTAMAVDLATPLPPLFTMAKAGKLADAGEGAFTYFMKQAETLDVSTMRNSSVFYSGKGNRELAEAFATSNGKTTLEMTSGGKRLDELKLFGSNSPLSPNQATQVWSRLSQRYAEGASGYAIGFVNGSRTGSIFNSVEYPALLSNKNVTNVMTGGN